MKKTELRTIDRVVGTVRGVLAHASVQANDLLLIALSGGADSVALIHSLRSIQDDPRGAIAPYRLAAAHLNHCLRGAESDGDEAFVRELCERLQTPLVVESANLAGCRSNLEERARDLRYEFLNRAADRLGARHIAIAHQADDQAETVLLRLLRGSGVAGLGAMAEHGPGRLIRPLLGVRRSEIVEYLKIIGAGHVTDSSNLSAVPVRNRLRHCLLPMLEREYAPGLTGRLVELAGEMRAFDDFINRQVKSELRCRAGHGRLRIAGFSELHPVVASGLLRGFLRDESGDLRGIHRHDIESLRHLCSTSCGDGIVTLPRGWRVRREYDMAIMERAEQDPTAPFALPLAPEGETKVDGANFVFDASVTAGDRLMQTVSTLARSKPMEAAFDLDQIRGALRIRSFQLGDRVRPLGMNGTRKVHDVFVDAKLPRRQRQAWPLVVADDEILWIPGMVRSVMAPVTSATKNLLFVRARQQNNEEMARCL